MQETNIGFLHGADDNNRLHRHQFESDYVMSKAEEISYFEVSMYRFGDRERHYFWTRDAAIDFVLTGGDHLKRIQWQEISGDVLPHGDPEETLFYPRVLSIRKGHTNKDHSELASHSIEECYERVWLLIHRPPTTSWKKKMRGWRITEKKYDPQKKNDAAISSFNQEIPIPPKMG